jgi:hypothetical protein
MDAADGGTGVLIGSSGDGASVQDDYFGLIGGGSLETVIEQLPLNGRAIGLCCTASEVLHVIGGHIFIILSQSMLLFARQL